MMQRAHVVQPVGELHQHDPDVTRHRDDHLAEVLGLLLLAALEGNSGNLGHAVDQLGDFGAEGALDLDQRGRRILDHVVQQSGNDRRNVELEAGGDQRDVERMNNVGLARLALLRRVHLRGIFVGAPDQRLVGLRIVGMNPCQQFIQPVVVVLG